MTLTDPLEALADAPDAPPDGRCVCGGGGYLFVDDDYVSRQAAKPHHRADDGSIQRGLLDALRDSVVPCHMCRPEQYNRWAKGCYAQGHSCADCRPRRRRSGRA